MSRQCAAGGEGGRHQGRQRELTSQKFTTNYTILTFYDIFFADPDPDFPDPIQILS